VICVDVASAGNEDTASIIIRESGKEARSYTCDVSDRDAVFDLAKKVGHVDILVNNAGILSSVSLLDATPEQLTEIMDVNTVSHFWVSSCMQVEQHTCKGAGVAQAV
jgi:all-trans-retinol dehydrogenase (NAD+)